MQVIARRLPEIQNVHNIRVFEIADKLDIAADLEMSADLTLEEAHAVSDRFEERIRELVDNIESLTLHLETTMTKDEAIDITSESSKIVESVKDIVQDFSPPVSYRNATIMKEISGIAVLLDCAISGVMTLTESHEVAEAIKKRVLETLLDVKTVYLHFGPI
jgi:divalent metal cation (Fe/Co/Zn/Cd) transporter